MTNLRISCYNGNSLIWTVVRLTTAIDLVLTWTAACIAYRYPTKMLVDCSYPWTYQLIPQQRADFQELYICHFRIPGNVFPSAFPSNIPMSQYYPRDLWLRWHYLVLLCRCLSSMALFPPLLTNSHPQPAGQRISPNKRITPNRISVLRIFVRISSLKLRTIRCALDGHTKHMDIRAFSLRARL